MVLIGRLIRLGLTLAGCAIVAAVLLPHPVTALRQLDRFSDRSTADSAAATDLTLTVSSLAAWALIVWLTTTLLMLAATQLPGRLGAAARAASCLVIPAIVRRLVCSALSISLAGGILAGTAQAAGPPGTDTTSRTMATSQRVSPPPDLDWPQPGDGGGDRTDVPAVGDTVTVKPGDSLWRLAAQSLEQAASDRAIAAAWPTWWEHNRDVIGENPHLIYPGQQLDRPKSSD